ncbi:hypothetical protein CBR_g44380 [Chara braunii]|uniref:Reverse transcriptase domain-containing protein n=1 Tax=Chara braunii TaxID=69332 RepID=A0A388LXC6_CHABU|nr:hypothetical protein CBR_g44380 [Chara braunii]|eukprot:GBG86925.1 hypothetical protein CBR_g44380 [Chara braunii]
MSNQRPQALRRHGRASGQPSTPLRCILCVPLAVVGVLSICAIVLSLSGKNSNAAWLSSPTNLSDRSARSQHRPDERSQRPKEWLEERLEEMLEERALRSERLERLAEVENQIQFLFPDREKSARSEQKSEERSVQFLLPDKQRSERSEETSERIERSERTERSESSEKRAGQMVAKPQGRGREGFSSASQPEVPERKHKGTVEHNQREGGQQVSRQRLIGQQVSGQRVSGQQVSSQRVSGHRVSEHNVREGQSTSQQGARNHTDEEERDDGLGSSGSSPPVVSRRPSLSSVKSPSESSSSHGRSVSKSGSSASKSGSSSGSIGVTSESIASSSNSIAGRLESIAGMSNSIAGRSDSETRTSALDSAARALNETLKMLRSPAQRRSPMSRMEKGGKKYLLKDAKAVIEGGGNWILLDVIRTKRKAERVKAKVIGLLRAPWKRKELLKKSLEEMLEMDGIVHTLRERRGRQIGMKKFGINPRTIIVIKVPFNPGIRKKNIYREMECWLKARIRHSTLCNLLVQRMRVIWAKTRTIANILHNQKLFSGGDTTCTCEDFQLPRVNGHVQVRLSEIDGIKSLLHNSKNTPVPGGFDSTQEINRACNEGIKPLKRMGLIKGGEAVRMRLHQLEWRQPELQDGMVLAEYVKGVKQSLRGLVLSPVDRNNGETLVECPMLYATGMRTMFNENPNYEEVEKQEKEVLLEMRGKYKEAGIGKWANWDNVGRLQESYVIAKDKDLCKRRPVVPSFCNPARHAAGILSKALNYMLKEVGREHFNLHGTLQLKEEIAKVNKKAHDLAGMDSRISIRTYDIKEMFTQLPHDEVRASVQWLVNRLQDKGLRWIRIKVKGKKVTFGKSHGEDGWKSVRMKALDDITSFLLDNTFFKAGGKVLKQMNGIPMGGRASLCNVRFR